MTIKAQSIGIIKYTKTMLGNKCTTLKEHIRKEVKTKSMSYFIWKEKLEKDYLESRSRKIETIKMRADINEIRKKGR